jgi:hypothetical protein
MTASSSMVRVVRRKTIVGRFRSVSVSPDRIQMIVAPASTAAAVQPVVQMDRRGINGALRGRSASVPSPRRPVQATRLRSTPPSARYQRTAASVSRSSAPCKLHGSRSLGHKGFGCPIDFPPPPVEIGTRTAGLTRFGPDLLGAAASGVIGQPEWLPRWFRPCRTRPGARWSAVCAASGVRDVDRPRRSSPPSWAL